MFAALLSPMTAPEVPGMTTPFRHHRGEVAALSRSRPPDDPDLIRAKELMREARMIEHIRQLVDAAPPLGPEARARIASVLAHPAAAQDTE